MVNETQNNTEEPIDVVITWVDGSDPELTAKQTLYFSQNNNESYAGAHSTRFASVNEIKYCLLSILHFAPFVRNIFIVTDNQNPNIWDDVGKYFPHKRNVIKIVDHREIFEGFEIYLPTFNSITIECMLGKIKGLSNNFVYFNDDMFIIRPIKPIDWFVNNKPVLRVKWSFTPIPKIVWHTLTFFFNRYFLGNSNYEPRVSFYIGQWNSAKLLGFRFRFLANSHTPYPVSKNLVNKYFEENRPLLEKNLSYKIRAYTQFTYIGISNHLQLIAGNKLFAKPCLSYLQPYKRGRNYINNKLNACLNDSDIKFLCVQSLDLCSDGDRQKLYDWMDKILEIRKC